MIKWAELTLRTPRKQSAETKSLPLGGMSLSSAGSRSDMARTCCFGRYPRVACDGYGPGWRVGSGGESSKLPASRKEGNDPTR
jgi:hypothetical protein